MSRSINSASGLDPRINRILIADLGEVTVMSRAPSNRHSQRIAVIGAGVAGATAARTLRREGFRVSVFDKGRGPGGRTSRRRVANFEFDHGAPCFTVREPRFAALIEECRGINAVADWRHRQVEIDEQEVRPVEGEAVFVGVPGMSGLVRCLLDGLTPRYEAWIHRIDWTDGHWRLESDESERFGEFDGLIIAIPAPQAASLLHRAASVFAAEAERVSMRPCWALMLAFDEPLKTEFDSGRVCFDYPIQWLGRNNSKPDRPTGEAWVVHASHAWSETFLEAEPERVAIELLRATRNLLTTAWAPPIFSAAHRWRFARVARGHDEPCLFDSSRNLAIAGDWLIAPRVEAAFQSGVAAAERLMRSWA